VEVKPLCENYVIRVQQQGEKSLISLPSDAPYLEQCLQEKLQMCCNKTREKNQKKTPEHEEPMRIMNLNMAFCIGYVHLIHHKQALDTGWNQSQ